MKKLLTVVLIVILAGCVAVPAVAPTNGLAQTLVALPDEGRLLVLSLVTGAVAWLLSKVSMGQFTQALAAVIAPILITAIEHYLQMIPPVFDNLVLSLIHLLVLFIGAIGTVVFFKRVRTPQVYLSG